METPTPQLVLSEVNQYSLDLERKVFARKTSRVDARAHARTVFLRRASAPVDRLGLQALVVLHDHLPSVRVHEALRGRLSLCGHLAHLRPRDGLEIVLARRIEEVHLSLGLVVGR